MNNALVAVIAGLFGATFGSFLNVCIVRLPEGMSVVSPPSSCPRCGHEIRWFENIPIFSWLALRGRCSGCGLSISPLYPLVELFVGLVWALAFWHLGASFDALRVAVFATVLTGIGVTDLRTYTIPDGFTVFGIAWVGLTAMIATFVGDTGLFATPLDGLFGACTGAGAIAIAMWLGEWVLGREAMGFGDVTLMAVAGAAIGPSRALLTIFLGALIGTVVFLAIVLPLSSRRQARAVSADAPPVTGEPTGMPLVPFGVFLAPAALITLLWGDALVSWYLSFISR